VYMSVCCTATAAVAVCRRAGLMTGQESSSTLLRTHALFVNHEPCVNRRAEATAVHLPV
jgi:hypothetical protein